MPRPNTGASNAGLPVEGDDDNIGNHPLGSFHQSFLETSNSRDEQSLSDFLALSDSTGPVITVPREYLDIIAEDSMLSSEGSPSHWPQFVQILAEDRDATSENTLVRSGAPSPDPNTWHLPPSRRWEDERSGRVWTRPSNPISEGPFVIYEDPPGREVPVIEPAEPGDRANNHENGRFSDNGGPDKENVDPATIAPDVNPVDPFGLSLDPRIVEFDQYHDDYAGDDSWPRINGRRVLRTLWTDPTQESENHDLTYDSQAIQTGRLRLGSDRRSPYAHLPLSAPARRAGPRRTGPRRTGPHRTAARRDGVRRSLDFDPPEVRQTTPEIEDEADDEASDARNAETENR